MVHDRQHMLPALIPHALMLEARNVELQHFTQMQFLSRLGVHPVQSLGPEVDQVLDVARIQSHAVDDGK